ncbi:hypothetical protein SCLCIDRAFT_776812 [Scleroderma citrinum Foug A]|uniref:Uncharacterized protein n=1 Tax=Scleroderma citrinum Foug A TaxID=1036808 RepID=A0A0C3DQ82_9AGAM|nr:hypothetical protein SCLCIDRAFT_776812 [Scleroderma citrinum Foug A]
MDYLTLHMTLIHCTGHTTRCRLTEPILHASIDSEIRPLAAPRMDQKIEIALTEFSVQALNGSTSTITEVWKSIRHANLLKDIRSLLWKALHKSEHTGLTHQIMSTCGGADFVAK